MLVNIDQSHTVRDDHFHFHLSILVFLVFYSYCSLVQSHFKRKYPSYVYLDWQVYSSLSRVFKHSWETPDRINVEHAYCVQDYIQLLFIIK